jgi:hypothetical protein
VGGARVYEEPIPAPDLAGDPDEED